ncbi:MAG: serine hydrolase [Verrucomicrobia bacterium]|nr:serine hydrolase [Verrucomicrobiota bacterium]
MANNGQKDQPSNSRSDKLVFLAVALGASMFQVNSGAVPAQGATEPIWPTKEWQTSSPEEQGMDSKELAKAVDFGSSRILSTAGATPVSRLDSLLVVRHGKIVVEAYYAPYAAGILHQVNSVTKAVTSTLIAIASKDGLLDSPSHRVLNLLDRDRIASVDSRKEAITVQNLLDMTSGIAWMELGLEGTPDSSVAEMARSPDWIQFILDRPMRSAPGDEFNYNSGNQHLLSAILTKLTGMSTLEYAKAKLFGPLGIKSLNWWQDPQGITVGGYGLFLEPRDMAKIGYLYLRNGVWEGQQLLPLAWIDKVNHAAIDMHLEPGLRYSNCFWALPEKHVYMAVGYRGQVVMVFPDLDIVAVTTGRDSFSLNKFADLIAGSVKSDTSLPTDPASVQLLASKILDISIEKPTEVGPTSTMAATISGKVYHFPPNEVSLKSLSLILTDPQPRYDIETYSHDATKSGPRFTGPIGLDGLYRKGNLTDQGASNPFFGGPPKVRVVNAVKGTWIDDHPDNHTFVIDWRVLGLANYSEERWTLTFDGEKLNVRVKFGFRPEISVDGKTGA